MKFFIVLSAVAAIAMARPGYQHGLAPFAGHGYHGPPAPLAHDGRVVDTPEVAHVKAAHFAAHAEAAAQAHHAAPHGDYGYGDSGYQGAGGYEHAAPAHAAYHGPPAPLGHDGQVIDTPEVAHAKAAHIATHAAEYAKVAHHGHSGYYGAPAHHW